MRQEILELRQVIAKLTPEQLQSAHGKALARRLIRMDYESWCRYRMKKVGRVPAQHHLLMIKVVQELLDGEYLPIRNVALLMPPGAAKSTYTSLLLPPFYVNPSRNPQDLILACSYSYSLVEGFGRQARDMVEEETDVLGVALSRTASASGDWRTSLGGGYFCAGVNAGIAGHRARFGLIDDFIGSEEEAQSQLIRDKNWNWYWNDFFPRLWPDAYQLLICNHRNEDDLVGRMLSHAKESKKWLVIKLPMLAEEDDPLGRKPGERLWPEWFTEEQVETAKQFPGMWAGLYQQRPAPEEGAYFKKDWIVPYNNRTELPKNLRVYMGNDYAVREESLADSHCFIPAGVDASGDLWIFPDWFWERADTDVAVEKTLDYADLYKPISVFSGRENITGSIKPFMDKRMRERGVYVYIEEFSEARNKEQKAQPIRGMMSARRVHFPVFAPQWSRALHQILSFPNGKNDDVVDALAKLGQGLNQMVSASHPKPKWNGVIEEQRLTCRWVEQSHRRKQRAERMALVDN